jgi:glycosyltransferase involved in cell wall biosynthesis
MPKIIEQVPNCRLLILNPYEQAKERSEFMALAQSMGVASHIEFLPKLKEEALPYYFSLAMAVIQPSLYVSTHMPLAEGAACETPAIAFDGINADEDIVDGETGFITPAGNIDMLAQKTVELLQNPDLRAKMGKNARERVIKLFSWDHNADLMMNMAKDVCKKV